MKRSRRIPESSAAPLASLLRFTARSDPSREPPGDELTAVVVLAPGVEAVDLEFEAVDVAPGLDGASSLRRLQGEGAAYRGGDGRFRLTARASRAGGDALVRVVARVPRSALRLDGGSEGMRYTVTGRIEGEEVFFSSTRPRTGPPASPMAGASPPSPSAPQAPAPEAPTSPFAEARERTILFATNRAPTGGTGTPSERFGDLVDVEVRYGSCAVNVPTETRTPGEFPLPRRGAEGDPARQFFILKDLVRSLDEAGFRSLVRETDAARDVLVYVHGFNTGFDFAATRMAQVVEDLGFPGLPMVFSWPARQVSLPLPGDYSRDEENADRSHGALARVFKTLVDEQAARPPERRGKIHLIAHSLGNRVAMRALAVLDTMLPAGAKPMGRVVLAAPDVSIEEFGRLHPAVARRSERVTLYFNPNDQALWASFVKHGRERRAGNSAQFLPGLDDVDAARVDTSMLGHGYWSDSGLVLADLHLLIVRGWEPARRVPEILKAYARPRPYWAFAVGRWWWQA